MHFNINGQEYTEERDTTLLDYLRNTLNLTGAKDGCSEGACGTCSVIIDGKLRKACSQKLSKLDGARITTIEGLSDREKSVYGYAFAEAGAVQCGFCIPGMIMAGKALIDSNPDPSGSDVRKAIRGNICRCTGYVKIEKAILLAARIFHEDIPIPEEAEDPRLSGDMKRIDALDKLQLAAQDSLTQRLEHHVPQWQIFIHNRVDLLTHGVPLLLLYGVVRNSCFARRFLRRTDRARLALFRSSKIPNTVGPLPLISAASAPCSSIVSLIF